ncbi:MAG: gamma-glutamyltransferase family protein [Saprospiraceae bacterium]|nr:gamma-glutamyltransferase family protein [Saprospiraceae bacterium]
MRLPIFRPFILVFLLISCYSLPVVAQSTQKPVLHAQHWIAITGKPLAATSGANIFHKGGNAVDAACAMLATTSTMWDVLSWGGETQALIYNPKSRKVIAINALGVAPTGATADFFIKRGLKYPPQFGPLAAVTPGTPGGLLTMLAEYGTLSLKEILEPAIEMAGGYPIEDQLVRSIARYADTIRQWPYSKDVFLPHAGATPEAGEIFVQQDLKETLLKMVEAETNAIKAGKSRKEAIYAAYDRFYRGDIAQELVRGTQEQGGLITMEDLDRWKVYIEEPVMSTYKDIEVYKLNTWVQGPVLLQALNMMEHFDMNCMSYNSANYLHGMYQVMNMCFADRDFYYGDPYYEPAEPVKGLLSKEYARKRFGEINWEHNDVDAGPGDPYPFQGEVNPYGDLLQQWSDAKPIGSSTGKQQGAEFPDSDFYLGTTSIQTADKEGWVVSITPSGGWVPAVIAGKTGVGLSQRMQSFVLTEEENPYNVVEPGKRPRATLTPSLALKNGKPYLSFAVQGGDSQDQNLLQFFLNMTEFGMTVQEAVEAANMNSFQMRGSFANHETEPGVMLIHSATPPWTQKALRKMGYKLRIEDRTSGPINAIYFDSNHGTMWGGSSNFGEDYGIGW